MFGVLWETLSEPSGRFASLSACAAVRPILYSSLQSDDSIFLLSTLFCFLGGRTAVSCPSFIDRLQLVCFVKGNSLFPFFRGCPSPLSATPTFPHTVGNHPRRAEPARPQSPAACNRFPPLRAVKRLSLPQRNGGWTVSGDSPPQFFAIFKKYIAICPNL